MTLRYLLPLNRITAILLLSLAACCHAAAQDYDAENGEDINEVCAGCHGEFGQGGSDGEYPRLAGMPMEFIARQLRLFRDRERPNMAMIEYVDERQMPDADIRDIATFLARITLKTKLPPVNESDPGFDAYARLLESKQVMQIPRAEGDQAQGENSTAGSAPPATAGWAKETTKKRYPCLPVNIPTTSGARWKNTATGSAYTIRRRPTINC